MHKGKKGEKVNIGTKRTDSSNIQNEKSDIKSRRNDK